MAGNAAIPTPVYDLADKLAALPGIGPKSAMRLAVYLTLRGSNLREALLKGLENVGGKIQACSVCGGLSESSICAICSDPKRDDTQLLIVESAVDCAQIEESGAYLNKYLILGGLISPINGITPDQLRLDLLAEKLAEQDLSEITIALPINMEGEATILYLQKLITDKRPDISVFRLARGLPTGANIEYLDPQTLHGAFSGKTRLE